MSRFRSLLTSAFLLLTLLYARTEAELPQRLDSSQLQQRLRLSEQRIERLEAALRMAPGDASNFDFSTSDRSHELTEAVGARLKSEQSVFDQRLSSLEENWAKSVAAEEQKKNEAAKKPSLRINGRVHLDYWNFVDESAGIGFFENPASGVDPQDRLFFRRVRLSLQGDLLESMTYRMQIDFNSPDSGEMKDVYIGFKALPVLGTLLVGNQKRPLGLDHLNSSRFNIFIERPLAVEAFNEDARRVGICSYNQTEDMDWLFHCGIFALENLSRDGEIIGDSIQPSGNARLASSPWYDESSGGRGYFHWAISGMVAKPDGDVFAGDTNANEGRFRTRSELRSDQRWLDTGRIAGADWYEILGIEAMLNIGAFHVTSEYMGTWMQRDVDTPGTGPDLRFHGGYVQVAYMLTGEHIPYNRSSGTIGRVQPVENFLADPCHRGGGGWGAWQVALRYSHLDLSDRDVLGGVANNLTAGLVWYFSSHSSLQFNAIYGDIDQRAPASGFGEGCFTALGARFRANF